MSIVSDSIGYPIIGLCGYARVGKTAIATAIGWHKVAFADALKADLAPLFPQGTPKEDIRDVLVAYGKAWRAIDPDHWVKRAFIPDRVPVVVDDVRYQNEVDFIHNRGGLCFRVKRNGCEPANDEEAYSLSVIDAAYGLPVIHNDGTVGDAAREVVEYLSLSATY